MLNETCWLKQSTAKSKYHRSCQFYFCSFTVLLVLIALSCQHAPGIIFDTSAILVFPISLLKLLGSTLSDMEKDLACCLLQKTRVSPATSHSLQLICLQSSKVNGPATTNLCMKKLQAGSVNDARVLLRIANCIPKHNGKVGSHPVYEKTLFPIQMH